MSYTALARKWRPRRFTEMVGQEHVLKALENALTGNRVHHAFLFTGTRGVGKTTVSRILAKCLNCETGVTAAPCGVCSTCREIDEGRFVDLIEVDAASRTKVDDTRDLLDNVQYSPARGRYKVYLIDEVHMLSTHSFNALLKTLEEPPPHVKFLLATTDPQKLPVTVLSRCLQFNLKRLPVPLIADRMRHILEAEALPFDAPALRLVAQAADGSMRDGLSLLDQLIAFGGGQVSEGAAREMLGTIDRDRIAGIAERLVAGDAGGMLAAARALDEWAPDYGYVLDQVAGLMARVALKQSVPDLEADEFHAAELVERLASAAKPEDVQLYYQIAILGRRDLPLAPDPRVGFEMTLLRMLAFRLSDATEARGAPSAPGASRAPARHVPNASRPASASGHERPGEQIAEGAAERTAERTAERSSAPIELSAERWGEVVAQLELSGLARQLATHCAYTGREGAMLRLALDARHQSVRTRSQEDKLAQALSKYLGETVRLEFDVVDVGSVANVATPAAANERQAAAKLESARDELTRDPVVQALKDRFGATLHPEAIRPNK